ncbi:MAG: hypothetical protein ACM3H7_02665, partial [Acidobacteriaceae bacterium]
MDQKKAQNKKNSIVGMVMLGIFALVFLIVGGQSTRLTCKHERRSGMVSCTAQTVWLWLIPLGTRLIDNVNGAQLGSSETPEGDPVYRVEILTNQGSVPLNRVYSSGFSTKQDVVDEINRFVKNTPGGMLTTSEPGLFSLENVVCMIVW